MIPIEATSVPAQVKIVIAGGFGAGKTTLVGAVSEIRPMVTEELLTEAGSVSDPLTGVPSKQTTTVAMDFGRITFGPPLPMVVYLFGTPGQQRFAFVWDDLSHGAAGAVVLADTRRLADSFPAVGYFEDRQVPFVVAVNEFEGAPHRYSSDEVRTALGLSNQVPVVRCDARHPESVGNVLITLVRHALGRTQPTAAQVGAL